MIKPEEVKKDFPILSILHPSGKPLVYLDSAATSQKPQVVIKAITNYYETSNANVHRGIHFLGDRSTKLWHESRQTIASFFGATSQEFIVVRNTTEAINFVVYTWVDDNINEGDVIISTQLEHHSNLVPWQEVCKRKKAQLELIPITVDGVLDLEWLRSRVEKGSLIKVVALSHVSNTLGTVNPLEEISQIIKPTGAVLIVDGAQAVSHIPVNFANSPADFYAVSAHKMLGPMGIGALLVKKERLKSLKPWLFGGGMIGEVHDQEATFSDDVEDRFTAGTPDVAGAVGWAAACTYLKNIGMENVFIHDQELVFHVIEKLSSVPKISVVGPRKDRCGSVAFIYEGVHAHDVAQILDSQGVAVRSGHHCTMPLHTKMNWGATTRVSFNVYTTKDDINQFILALAKVKEIFG